MDSTSPSRSNPSPTIPPAEDASASIARRRYETLNTIKTRAINGKGAWYWHHLEPILVFAENGIPKAAKVKCLHCNSTFSASNPSRTSNDHLKKGACPNFAIDSLASDVKPISSAPPASKKRPVKSDARNNSTNLNSYVGTSSNNISNNLLLSCGKEDLGALAMLEDSVKKLKSPKAAPGLSLPKEKADAAVSLLQEWVLESCGAVALHSLNHQKFKAFLNQVGLPAVDPRSMLSSFLDSKHHEVEEDTKCKIHDAAFFQLSCSGWKSVNDGEFKCVNFTYNLPNGTSVFHRAIVTTVSAPSSYAEELIDREVSVSDKCVGVVCDSYRSKALVNLENKHGRMVNVFCQIRAIGSLIKDFARNLALFESVIANCFRLVSYFNKRVDVRHTYQKYQVLEFGKSELFRAPKDIGDAISNFDPVFSMIEDVLVSVNPLHSVVLDEEYKNASNEDREAFELGRLIQNARFWVEVEAVYSIVKIIKDTIYELEIERPLVGQCLPLWNELRSKIHEWCNKFNVEYVSISKIIENRFTENYHPVWSAAFLLDPIYLIKEANGKYLPPCKLLSQEQVKDADRLITRLVSLEEAHLALMEFMAYKLEGLDPLYAQAVQMKQPSPSTGKMKLTNPQSSRLVWETSLSGFRTLSKVAVRIIFLHATTYCGLCSDPPVLKRVHGNSGSRIVDRVEKMISVAAHAKLERRDFVDGEKEVEILEKVEDKALVKTTSL